MRRPALGLVALMIAAPGALAAPPLLAPPEQALTFAFAERRGAREAFLVAATGEGSVSAIALATGDAFEALAARGEDELAALLRSAPRQELPIADLLPVLEGAQHVAVGANYAEHGTEVDVSAPFLFPKIAAPTPSQGSLAVQPEWLLDYEVEIAVVFDRDLQSPTDLAAARAGVLLVNDFTERAQLTLEADLAAAGVGRGFANAKGKPGFLPTGPFLVVPRDWRAFVRDCEIRLSVNGAPHQQATGGELIWSVDEIVRRALALGAQPAFVHAGRPVALAAQGIPRGVAILTGTPGGVAFRTPGVGFVVASGAWWTASLAFLESDVATFTKQRWIRALRRGGSFLRPGDVVIAEGRGLGAIVTQLEAPPP